jgi:hypothetical protein
MPDYLSAELKSLIETIDGKIRKISKVECLEIGLASVAESGFCANANDIVSVDSVIVKLRSKINMAADI